MGSSPSFTNGFGGPGSPSTDPEVLRTKMIQKRRASVRNSLLGIATLNSSFVGNESPLAAAAGSSSTSGFPSSQHDPVFDSFTRSPSSASPFESSGRRPSGSASGEPDAAGSSTDPLTRRHQARL